MKKASLTLEAACVLPFFLTAVIAVLCFMQGISDAGRENEKMSASVKKMAVYAYAGQDTVAANLLKEGDIIEMVYPHRVKFRVPFIHIRNITVWEKFCVRAWTGRIPDGGEGSDEDEKNTKVYVTAEGSVYHRDRQCRHLKRHIEKVAASAVDTKRSSDGSKYYPCNCCKDGVGDSVYITRDGNRYHSSLDCGDLKRSVSQVLLSEVDKRRPCADCGGGT